MPLPNPPNGWGADELTKFIDTARHNVYATFDNLKEEYAKLSAVDAALRKLMENLTNTKDWFAAFFVVRAHSAFLAGVHLAMAGQIPEAYACLRLTIEHMLYGFYLAKTPASRETWLRRHDDDDAKKKVRDEFKYRTLVDTLKAADATGGAVAELLYDRTIDYGAHPNERALMQTLKMEKGEDKDEFQIVYLSGDSLALRLVLKTAAQVGACTLGAFRLIYKERFDLLGLTDALHQLRQAL